ncbi:MAG: 5'-methylthioadenosine/S-adenosylhomocysteine nucleosidase [Ruminococcus sp.]|uniref:5'-methylthioadenosine/S-adenosylhomocysteine nucleosidase n=1 Tax=Ruminococcus sp. TaxID=41978 RepID=UPI002872ED5D|nr:5'-methylthioadenosine/S-adenosylhomocysteine nucleosidase [Ruminococcus sp.]MBQ3285159.1 5'-methylthioadenosine/S-adenosylhomocysteine nucleosidase [Ruminococcus sp.]MBQ6120661.1 5'-methylthioadenosine/S-adenosylhomocysteine nucleosidase [Clostridia bacterium]
MKKPIVILGPMESESALLIHHLENKTEHKIGAFTYFKGSVDGYPVVVCRTYIGMVNSAAATALAIQHYDPLCVIIQGTSGAHNPALHQGDIVLGERLIHVGRFFTPHRDVGEGSDAFQWEPHGSEIVTVAPGEDTAVLYSDSRIIDIAQTVPYMGGRVIRGCIGAADIWNKELDMLAHLHRTLGTDCEEMEGFGVAQVCALFGVPMADIRVISNSEWHPEEEFNEKFGEQCQMFVLEVIRRLIAEKTLM